jgi:hypothetical protein
MRSILLDRLLVRRLVVCLLCGLSQRLLGVVEDHVAQSVLEGTCAGLAMSCHRGATLREKKQNQLLLSFPFCQFCLLGVLRVKRAFPNSIWPNKTVPSLVCNHLS